jgi:guanylate kinase
MKRPGIFIISGPSGSGKTTLAKKLLAEASLRGKLKRLVSFTTRPKRPAEKNKKDYVFVSQKKFFSLRKKKKFLEWTRYLGYYYATAQESFQQAFDQGKNVVLCLDQRGAFKIKRLYPRNTCLIFILAPSIEALKQRINLRAGKSQHKQAQEIIQRLGLAEKEIALAKKYDYCILNRNLNTAFRHLKAIVKKELSKRRST